MVVLSKNMEKGDIEIKFIVEVVLVVISLAIVLWWVFTNYSSLMTALQTWFSDLLGGG